MKEISRRAMSTEMSGMACSPYSTYAVDAEIVVEDEGHTVYLHTQWVDQAEDEILFEATTESIYDAELAINKVVGDNMNDFQKMVDKRNQLQTEKDISTVFGDIDINERYAKEYEKLLDMMQEILDRDEIGFDIHELEYFEDMDDDDE